MPRAADVSTITPVVDTLDSATRPTQAATDGEAAIAPLVTELLQALGEDPDREGLRATPGRVARSFEYLTSGNQASLEEIVNGALFSSDYSDVVLVRDIDVFSLCEHHLLPFYGKAHVAYLPRGKVIGLSKVPRIVEMFARRLQLQEQLTEQIAGAIAEAVNPVGVAVSLECTHLCMAMRGVQKIGSTTVTRSLKGIYADEPDARRELAALSGPQQGGHLWGV